MTPLQLVTSIRGIAHDTATPQKWSDDFIIDAYNEGRMEAARRARLIEDPTTAETCRIAVKVGKHTYDVDRRVIYVRRVKLALQDKPLPKLDIRDADSYAPGWESRENGTPVAWMPYGDYQIRLINPPDTADTMHLTVVREPLESLTIASTEDEDISPRYHYKIRDWVLYRMYMERDLIEKYRPEEARERLASFETEFGVPTGAAEEKWIHRRHGYDEFEGLY